MPPPRRYEEGGAGAPAAGGGAKKSKSGGKGSNSRGGRNGLGRGSGNGRRGGGKGQRFNPQDNKDIKAARSPTEVYAVLDAMMNEEEGRLPPNTVQINMAVTRLGRMKGGWRSASDLLRTSHERYGVKPNVITYNAAISACEKGRQWERALELLRDMEGKGVEPDVITYNAVIEGIPESDIGIAIELCSEAMSKGFYQVWNAQGMLDLHERSATESKALLAHTLNEFFEGQREVSDLVVITGQGHGSGSAGPVLGSATREFLTKGCDPPLEIIEVEGNPGRFVVQAASIRTWVTAQSDSFVEVNCGGQGVP